MLYLRNGIPLGTIFCRFFRQMLGAIALASVLFSASHSEAAMSCSEVFGSWQAEAFHDAVTNMLYNGQIVSYERRGKVGFTVIVRAKNPATGEFEDIRGYLKPRLPNDRNTFHESPYSGNERAGRSPMEYVAYHLNRLLGLDYLPPTVYRRDLNFEVDGVQITEGSISLEVTNLQSHQKMGTTANEDYQLLNYLMHNPDGNKMNSGLGVHWISGVPSPVFWDFSASFGQMAGYRGGPKKATISSLSLRKKLEQLSVEDFQGEIDAGMITPHEVEMILQKRDELIRSGQGSTEEQ